MLVCNTCDKYKVCHINKFVSSLTGIYLSIDDCSEYSHVEKPKRVSINDVNEYKQKQESISKFNDYKVEDGKIQCSCCKKLIPEIDIIETLDGKHLCEECFEKEDTILDSKYTR